MAHVGAPRACSLWLTCALRLPIDNRSSAITELQLTYFNWDHPVPSAYAWQDRWSHFSHAGVCGDATAATPEFGRRMFEVTVERFVELVREFRTIPIRERVDHH
jgi:creatinine amidohydrolase/Fe(II)-dependent formamide hydrolase-like protein